METSRGRLWFTLGVLLAINTLNFYDRLVPGVIAEPLRKELQLSDSQLGWLTPAFILLYAIVGVPLGLWADFGRRTRILAIGVIFWSLLTGVSGLAWSFASLFIMRLGVGIGEASCAPTSNSLLGDLFPRDRRARAISIYMLGLPLGSALCSLLSGWVAQQWGWRSAFYVAGVPGLLLGLLALAIPEPSRGVAEDHQVGRSHRPGHPIAIVLGIPTMWWIIASGALHNFNSYAIASFLSPYLQRYHGLTVQQAGGIGFLVYGIGGMGILLGGWVCDWAVRHRVRGRLEVTSLALLASGACLFLALQQGQGNFWAFTAAMLPGYLFLYMYYSGVYATIQDVVEPALRGTAMAVYFFVMYIFAAFGPVIVGKVSDFFATRMAQDPEVGKELAKAIGLHDAFYLIPILCVPLALVLWAASRTVTRDYENLTKWMGSQGNNTHEESAVG